IAPESMGTLKTLGQIVAYLVGTRTDEAPPSRPEPVFPLNPRCDGEAIPNSQDIRVESLPNPATVTIQRQVVTAAKAPPATENRISIAKDCKILVTDGQTGLAAAIKKELEAQDFNPVLISPAKWKQKTQMPRTAGLVIIPDPESKRPDQDLKDALTLTRHLAHDLMDSAQNGGALLATVTRQDGAFGFKGEGIEKPWQGGLAGLVKTAAIEWQGVCCHAIDIAPQWQENRAIAEAVVREILTPGPVEIGLEPDLRWTPVLEPHPYPWGEIKLAPGEVVVISGGARGITAAAARALAQYLKPTLVLLGRSPHPVPEPAWLAALSDETAIKKAILANEYSGNDVSPQMIEKAFKARMANREIADNLSHLKATGAAVSYYSVDIRDAERVQSILNEVRATWGPITAVIHGAGVLEDRLIIHKTPEQFERVFTTKVNGFEALLQATHKDPLRYLVIFSSVAARMGNRGQVDYAMANEVLNKMAQQESFQRPGCRVISINWGPWDGGMVTKALKREFEGRGVALIPADDGARCMLYEMQGDKTAPVEVVIGGQIPVAKGKGQTPVQPAGQKPTAKIQPRPPLSLTFTRELDVKHYPILQSHIIDGKPVVPLALIAEWFGHGALHENPGLVLHGLDDIRILKGMRLEGEKGIIRILAGKARKKGSLYEVELELRNGHQAGKAIIHSRARAILTDSLAPPPTFNLSAHLGNRPYARSVEEVYDQILFHGLQLHGIRKIVSCSAQGMVAHISAAPPPIEWMTDPLRHRWLGDPLVLDSAFQMATLWCFEEKGAVSLPSYSASYRQYRSLFPSDGVTVVLEVRKATTHKMCGDFTFLDAAEEVVARLTGYEAIINPSLFKAFKPQYAAIANE
ncbi:MAG: SDR family NAD(P)-dependent oxidoreductase, partial [Desulfobacterales bacterium]